MIVDIENLPQDAIIIDVADDVIRRGTCSLQLKNSPNVDNKSFVLVREGMAFGVVKFGKRRLIESGRGNTIDKGWPCSVVTAFDEPLTTNVAPDASGIVKNVALRMPSSEQPQQRPAERGQEEMSQPQHIPLPATTLPAEADEVGKAASYSNDRKKPRAYSKAEIRAVALAAMAKQDEAAAELAGEGGVHMHALDRQNATTATDGRHQHAFVIDGELVITDLDGDHIHRLKTPISDVSEAGSSAHMHRLVLPDGTEIMTSDDGEHMHALQVSKSGLDGLHQHTIKVGDTDVSSLTPGQFFELFGDEDSTEDEGEEEVANALSLKLATLQPVLGLKLAAPLLSLLDTNDDTIDLMVHGPVSPSVQRAIEDELAKRLPSDQATKLRVLSDDLGIPTVASVPLARIAIEFGDTLPGVAPAPTTVKGLEVMPVGRQRGALHYEFTEAGDYVMKAHLQADEQLITWELEVARAANLHSVIKSVAEAEAVVAAASIDGSRYQRPLRGAHVKAVPTVGNSHVLLEHQGKIYGAGKGVTAVIDRPSIEYGLQLDGYHEYFLSGTGVAKGVLICSRNMSEEAPWSATIRKSNLPTVLTNVAVERGIMPPLGRSGLPAMLEKEIPSELQFWRAPTAKAAQQVRDALVKAQWLTDDNVRFVDGEFRRVTATVQHHIAKRFAGEDSSLPPAAPEDMDPVRKVATMLPNDGRDVVLFDRALAETMGPADVAKHAASLDGDDFLIAYPDSPGARFALAKCGRLFKLAGHPATVFVTSAPFVASNAVEWLPDPADLFVRVEDERVTNLLKRIGDQRVAIIKSPEERFVFGIVLEPETVDAQNDIYSDDEIRRAAHLYMEEFGHIKLMHDGAPIDSRVKILESYVAPVAFNMDGQQVKKGTWLLAVRVLDDTLWSAVKSGDLTGFSIGGTAVRTPR